MRLIRFVLVLIVLFTGSQSFAQRGKTSSFQLIPLGIRGGADENNLSSYMLAPSGSKAFVCLDAGTLHAGIKKAIKHKALSGTIEEILKNSIKGYLISHGHADHIFGLVINSPDDSPKYIYSLPYVEEVLKEKYFNWRSWANFTNEGDKPTLNKYKYVALHPGVEAPLQNTGMFVTAFPLAHGSPYLSSAFLIRSDANYLLYLGDTGPDPIEKSTKMAALWQQVAPLIVQGKLKAICIETSFSNDQADNQLFGHLTPDWLMKEMAVLGQLTGKEALKDFPVVITHMKPAGNRVQLIRQQLVEQNPLHLKLIFPEQGKRISF